MLAAATPNILFLLSWELVFVFNFHHHGRSLGRAFIIHCSLGSSPLDRLFSFRPNFLSFSGSDADTSAGRAHTLEGDMQTGVFVTAQRTGSGASVENDE